MNRRPLIFALVSFSLIILIILGVWSKLKSRRSNTTRSNDAASTEPPATVQGSVASFPGVYSAPTATPLPKTNQATLQTMLKKSFSLFESMGGGEKGPPFAYIEREVADRDKVKVLRAFDELLYRYSPSDSLPVLRSYVNDADPYTRYKAAQSLLVAGDDMGVPSLINLLKSDRRIDGVGNKEDLRVSAALILAKYHQTAAVTDMLNVYSKTRDVQLSKALANLGTPLPNENDLPFVSSRLAVIEYAQNGTIRFLPQIKTLFEHTDDSTLKAAAAWSLTTMTGDSSALNFLVGKARSDLDRANSAEVHNEREMIKYVGTLKTPEAKQTLEAALENSDPVTVEIAIVNLLYNQGGSELAIEKVADQLNNSASATLPWDFIYQVTAKFLHNPVLQTAGSRFAQRNHELEWRRNVVERRNWPSDNWVGDYVIQIK